MYIDDASSSCRRSATMRSWAVVAAPPSPRGTFGADPLHRFDLPFEHRQPILFAAQGHRRIRLLLAEPGDHLQVRLRLLREAAHVRFLDLAQALLDILEAVAALRELGGEERRRVLGAGFAQRGVFVDERRGQAIGDALVCSGVRPV